MAIVEQNISSVKLEKMREKAYKNIKRMFQIPLIAFFIILVVNFINNRKKFSNFFTDYSLGQAKILDGIFLFTKEILMAFFLSMLFVSITYIYWKKSYDIYNYNYKNKYVLSKIKEVPLFSELKYSAIGGLTFDELSNINLLPGKSKLQFLSEDYFEGIYDTIPFRSSRIEMGNSTSSMPLFQGQVIIFKGFHEFKKSKNYIQIFSRKESDKMKNYQLPIKIETENENFNNQFLVFAQEKYNAFYILTPQLMEDIIQFAEIINNSIYILFWDKYMYVACEQLENPFDAFVDIPVEEQSQNIKNITNIIQKGRDILVQL